MATKQELLPTQFKSFQLKSEKTPDWCPGCGDFGIVNAVQQALAETRIKPWEVSYFTGVGCSGKASQYSQTYGVHTLHGRVLPYALGAKITNPELTVIAAGGDGDGLGIGGGHFLHAGRRNVDITYILFNNEVYGLTKGQASPTLEIMSQPKSLALPHISQAVNPLALAIACGYTFVARSYSFDAKHLKNTLVQAIQHKGVSYVDVLQPCPTYNNLHPKEYYSEKVLDNGTEMPRIYYLEQEGYDGVVPDGSSPEEVNARKQMAIQRAYQLEERVGLGVYWKINLPTYEERLKQIMPPLREYAPAKAPYYDDDMTPTTDLSNALAEFVV